MRNIRQTFKVDACKPSNTGKYIVSKSQASAIPKGRFRYNVKFFVTITSLALRVIVTIFSLRVHFLVLGAHMDQFCRFYFLSKQQKQTYVYN